MQHNHDQPEAKLELQSTYGIDVSDFNSKQFDELMSLFMIARDETTSFAVTIAPRLSSTERAAALAELYNALREVVTEAQN